tara:strand:+ start:214 stop:546 length:333 start_codon:yes stop_codon:yes gene_type:complete
MVKDYLLVRFGSRWEVEVDRRYISRKDILDRYEDFKKDCIDNDYEYIIDEFGMCEEVGDGIILLRMSDDSSEMWIEINRNKELVDRIENGEDEVCYDVIEELELKYEVEF